MIVVDGAAVVVGAAEVIATTVVVGAAVLLGGATNQTEHVTSLAATPPVIRYLAPNASAACASPLHATIIRAG